MSVVFIGGSRRLARLNDTIRVRLDRIVERHHAVIIGDANGADRAVQGYLAERGYRHVTVYCTGDTCRNNVGAWPVHAIPDQGRRGREYYALKDAAMADAAECALMLWDGESQGTLANVRRLVAQRKPVVVYLSRDRACHTVRSEAELGRLVPATAAAAVPRSRRRGQGQQVLFPRG